MSLIRSRLFPINLMENFSLSLSETDFGRAFVSREEEELSSSSEMIVGKKKSGEKESRSSQSNLK